MLSVCIITKNEEQNLARCLKSFQNTGFELVVVDTGSTDQTKKIAAEYTENIYDFPWCDDFSSAKNFAISKATNPYVMVIDSDEYLQKIDLAGVEKMITEHPGEVGRIQRINIISGKDGKQENKEWINRIFAKESFHYTGRIHEQVTACDEKEYRTYEPLYRYDPMSTFYESAYFYLYMYLIGVESTWKTYAVKAVMCLRKIPVDIDRKSTRLNSSHT